MRCSVTIDINVEHLGLRVTAMIVTSDLQTHSQFQKVNHHDVDVAKELIRRAVKNLLSKVVEANES